MPKVTIALGSLLAIVGAICFLAMSGQGQSESIRPIGSAFFALGVLIIAAGVYLHARQIQARYQPAASKGALKTKKTDRLCSSCNQEPAVMFCRVHILRLCAGCFDKHDDGANCSYVPAKRATAAYK